jgi:hypothetical protein
MGIVISASHNLQQSQKCLASREGITDRLTLSFLLMLLAGPAYSDTLNGNEFHKDCQGSKSFVGAYVAGVTDKAALDRAFANDVPAADAERSQQVRDVIFVTRPYCQPENVTLEQATDVVCKYLKDKPEVRHFGGAGIVQNALREAFPCGK